MSNSPESYEALQQKLREKRLEFQRASAASQEAQFGVNSLQAELAKLESQLVQVIDTEKYKHLEFQVAQARRPYEDQVAGLDRELMSFPSRMRGILENLEVKSNVNKGEEALRKQAREITNQVGDLVKEGIGPGFYERYLEHLGKQNIKTTLSYEQVIQRFNTAVPRLQKSLGKKRNFLTRTLDTGSQMFDAMENNRNAMALGGGISLVALLASVVVLPLYLTAISVNSVRQVKRAHIFKQTLLEIKAVTDNLDALDKESADIYEKRYQEARVKEEARLEEEHAKIKQQRADVQRQLDNAEYNTRSTFQFDTTQIMDMFHEKQSSVNERLATVKSDFEINQKKMQSLGNEITSLESQLNSSIQDLVSYYLDYERIGTEYILKGRFLLDVVDNKPVFFDLRTDKPSFFLYRDDVDLVNFLKLIMVQLRGTMSTHSLRVQLWDDRRMGVDFQAFTNESSHLFKLLRETAEFKESLDTAVNLIIKRNSIVRREHSHINEYNEYMLSIDSLAEFYQIYAIISTSRATLESEAMSKLLNVGAPVGLLPMVFIKEEEAVEKFENILSQNAHLYKILNGKVTTVSRQFVLETMKQFGS